MGQASRQAVQVPQCALAIVEIADRVGDQDHVERAFESGERFRVLRVAHFELQVGMIRPRDIDHPVTV